MKEEAKQSRHSLLLKTYQIGIIVLAIISIVLAVLDIAGKISLSEEPFKAIDIGILIVFIVDYMIRILHSDDKISFVLHNIPDLLAIMPFYSLFSVFRIFRILKIAKIGRVLKFTRLFRLGAFASVISKRILGIINTNGLRYVIYVNIAFIVTASGVMTYTENMSFGDALWWSVVTCTTVGYGDIVPATVYGKITAVILMIFGIGFLGSFIGAVTTYFVKLREDTNKSEQDDLETLLASATEEERKKIYEIAKIIIEKE